MLTKQVAAWFLATTLCGGAQAGLSYSEAPPGAGSLPGTTGVTAAAQDVVASLSQAVSSISGSLASQLPVGGTPLYEVDLYRLFILDLAAFSAQATTGVPGDDLSLFLFDATGAGVMMNDDTATDLFPALPTGASGTAGFYFLAVALGAVDAVNAAAASVFTPGAFTDLRLGNGGLLESFFDPFTRFSEAPFAYEIALTGVGVPEPGTWALGLLGLWAVALLRRPSARR